MVKKYRTNDEDTKLCEICKKEDSCTTSTDNKIRVRMCPFFVQG